MLRRCRAVGGAPISRRCASYRPQPIARQTRRIGAAGACRDCNSRATSSLGLNTGTTCGAFRLSRALRQCGDLGDAAARHVRDRDARPADPGLRAAGPCGSWPPRATWPARPSTGGSGASPCASATGAGSRSADTALARAQGWYHRWGQPSLLFAWLPGVGDAFTVAAGVMRVPLLTFLVMVTIAKGGRYAAILGAGRGLDIGSWF